MPAEVEVPTVNEEVSLKDGLKWMFTIVSSSLMNGVYLPPERYAALEDEVVEAFIGGLRTNGYEIRPIRDPA